MKHLKRLGLLALALVMCCAAGLLLARTLPARAATIIASGTCGGEGDGKNLTWTLDDEGLLTISGTGEMRDFQIDSDAPWHSERQEITAVTIQEGVTKIGANAFIKCAQLASVFLPESLYAIRYSAFDSCIRLAELSLPEGLERIDEYAFYGCCQLPFISIPDSVSYIGKYALNGTLWYNNQPEGVVYAGRVAYEYKGKVPSDSHIEIKPGTVGISPSAFQGENGLTSISIPEGVTTIGREAFEYCTNLTSVELPDSMAEIDWFAFSNCYALQAVSFGDGELCIRTSAFSYCNGLQTISFGSGKKTIESKAFSSCNGMNRINISDLSSWCDSEFEDETANPLGRAKNLFLNGEKVHNLSIPEGVTKIGDYTFYNCIELESATFPDTVTEIGNNAFSGCRNLQTVNLPDCLTKIGDAAFSGTDLEVVMLPESTKTIGAYAFT